jgi:glycosyltransferase involved in cell wall biosynthesis
MTGSTEGRNVGEAGYSYDFVAQLFKPVLERWGEVVPVPLPRLRLETAIAEARARGLNPIHVSFLPFQDVCLAKTAPNVVVPAWEFPDVPNCPFNGNRQNDWPAMADQCELVIVGGPFTVNAFRRAGTQAPIRIVPVPTPDSYFQIPAWQPGQSRTLDCTTCEFPIPQLPKGLAPLAPTRRPNILSKLKQAGKSLERWVRRPIKSILGRSYYERLTHPLKNSWNRTRELVLQRGDKQVKVVLPYPMRPKLELSGVVYTSIFNPIDGRKNWQDLLTGFLLALGDRDDATLVIKLITQRADAAERLIRFYRTRDIPHRCKILITCDFMSDEQMLQLAEGTTFYLQTTKAEGNCLPLMNYLAAGRPGVSPSHSAISDYFDRDIGFVVDSHPEPSAWPHDRRLHTRTTWARLVWPSLCEQLQASYRMAKYAPQSYAAMAAHGRQRIHDWASYAAVQDRLDAAFTELLQGRLSCHESPTSETPLIQRRLAA